MSVLKDTSRSQFLETESFASTENLKEFAIQLIQGINMYQLEQNEWFDELPIIEEEEIEEIPFDIERPSLLG
jgi:hypothetical protein